MFFSYEMMFNIQYYLENSYILPLQKEFHIRIELGEWRSLLKDSQNNEV